MTDKLVAEILYHVEACGTTPTKISFIGERHFKFLRGGFKLILQVIRWGLLLFGQQSQDHS